ncbi:MAG: Gfo/Idh/MocA family oxidoreductase [Clostridia bacterium]|nr:Gfo/Idh/MocA family oxidoreductase [Clostridia bacterium]
MNDKIINIAFAGLRHGHIFVLYNMAKENKFYNITGAFESDENSKKTSREMGVIINYNSYEELLDDTRVDVVALGGCYGQRGQMAIDALKAGKHVIADKPLCTEMSELDLIEKLSKEKNLLVSCMFTMRFEKKINAVKKLYESGKLGEINNVTFGGQHPLQYGRRPMWYFEEGEHGGVINDIAIHGIDVLYYAFGMKIKDILAARCWNKYAEEQPDFKDSAQFMLTADNGAGIVADVSYAIPDGVEFNLPYYWQFYVWGTKGTVRFSLNENESYYYISGEKQHFVLDEQECETDYLTDFYNLYLGRKNVVLPVTDSLYATRTTLQIQKKSE